MKILSIVTWLGASGGRALIGALYLAAMGLLWTGFVAPVATAAEPSRTIRVAMDNNYPPYVFQTADGKLEGILIDQWQAWEKATGIKAEIHAMDWVEALGRMQGGEFDVIDTIFETAERRNIFAFSPAYAQIEVPIFFRKDISGITDLESLREFPVAVKRGDYAEDMVRAQGIKTVLPFHNYESIVTAARDHKINVFIVDTPPALYFLNKLGIEDEFRRSPPINLGEFHRAVRKGDATLLRTVNEGFAAVGATELKRIDEKWFGRTLGGSRYLVYTGYVAVAVFGLIAGLVGWNRALRQRVAHRTAALRESEERFRQVVENIQEVFWMNDLAANRIIYVSRAYEKIWGRSCESLYAAPGSWSDSIFPEDRERVRHAAATKQVSGDYDESYRIVAPDGAMRWVRARAFPVKDDKGKVVRIVGVAEDITGQKRLEEQFLRAQRMEAVGALSSGIAHDLNNILTPMLLSTTLLKSALHDSGDRELLQMLEQGAQRGAEIVRQLLIYSRGTEVQRTSVQVRHLLKEMTGIVRATFPRNIVIGTEAPDDLPPVLADATQLHQVLLNLCVNARDAMPAGGTLTLRARPADLTETEARQLFAGQPGRYVVVAVEDTGQGIARDVIDRIFDPFFTTKEIGKGSGLGLSTVLGIAKSHGGGVTVSSEPGRGTVFHVYLPMAPAAATVPSGTPATTSPAGATGELILVVDDEESIRKATRHTLEYHGYRVLTAGDGMEACALFVAHRDTVQLVLTDMMMPVMGGAALVGALRALKPGLKVIAMTGLDQEVNRAELAALGVTQFLMKPYDLQSLLEKVRQEIDAA